MGNPLRAGFHQLHFPVAEVLANAVPTVLFGVVERLVGAVDERCYRIVVYTFGKPDAHGDLDDVAVRERDAHVLHVAADSLCDNLRVLGRCAWQKHGEFLAAVAHGHVGGAQAARERLRDRNKHLVAGEVPVGVVHVLEVVDVEHECREREVALVAAVDLARVHFL